MLRGRGARSPARVVRQDPTQSYSLSKGLSQTRWAPCRQASCIVPLRGPVLSPAKPAIELLGLASLERGKRPRLACQRRDRPNGCEYWPPGPGAPRSRHNSCYVILTRERSPTPKADSDSIRELAEQ